MRVKCYYCNYCTATQKQCDDSELDYLDINSEGYCACYHDEDDETQPNNNLQEQIVEATAFAIKFTELDNTHDYYDARKLALKFAKDAVENWCAVKKEDNQ